MKRLLQLAALTFLCLAAALGTGVSSTPHAQAVATTYQMPCSGYNVNGYGFNQYVSGWGYHVGEDVCGGRPGSPFYAVADGVVVYSGRTPDSYRWGNLVMIQHTNPDGSQVTSVYGHMADNRQVVAGQQVTKGQIIGYQGPAWTAENGNWGAHLHFGLHAGPYHAAVGSYAADIVGYASAANVGQWISPGAYLASRATPPAQYDYQLVSVTGSGTYGKNQQYDVEIKIKNTGSTTWRGEGSATPMRLGTINPMDRGSGFSAGMGGKGWLYPNRIAMQADTPPGGIATFRATMNDATIPPGRYIERFAPVMDNVVWFADKGIALDLVVTPPRTQAKWVGQGLYTDLNPLSLNGQTSGMYLLPGQKLNAKFFVQNVGDDVWQKGGPNPVRLGTAGPRDRYSGFGTSNAADPSENWVGGTRPSTIDGKLVNGQIVPTDSIGPNEVAVFSFTMTVPNVAPGFYPEPFNPVMEGVTWLNDLQMWMPMRILPQGYHYEYVNQENPAPFAYAKGSATATVYLRNMGSQVWPVGGNVRLGTDRTRDRLSAFKSNDWFDATRPSTIDSNASNPASNKVVPGEIAKFTFTVSTQQVPDGTYNEFVRPVVDGVAWMPEDPGIYVPVTVQSPALDYTAIDQRFSKDVRNLKYGDEFTTTLIVRNLGKSAWSKSGGAAVRLGTTRPTDRGSGFGVYSGPDAWYGPNRPSDFDGKLSGVTALGGGGVSVTGQPTLPATEIKQGEVAVFTIPMKVPLVPPGSYNEYFNLVQETVSWFPDYGIYFPFFVAGP